MEEKILEIVKRNFEIRDGLINQAQKDTAEEVVDMVKHFTNWLSEKELSYLKGMYYVDRDGGVFELTFDELFDYWWNNIKDK